MAPRTVTPNMSETVPSDQRSDHKSFTAMKLAALDAAACDERLTHLDFRLLYYIASATDRETGIARRKQTVIANDLSVTARAIQLCTERLVTAGYVTVILKEGGSNTHGYRIRAKKKNAGLSIEYKNANSASPFSSEKRTRTMKKANDGGDKGEPPFVPTLPLHSLDIPYSEKALQDAVTASLRKRLGDDVFRSWFADITIAGVADGAVTLLASNSFRADIIRNRYELTLIDAWRSFDPSVERIVVIARKPDAQR